MNDLPKRLDIKAGVMEMGEKIAWGSDTALMREAAEKIRILQSENSGLNAELSLCRKQHEAVASELWDEQNGPRCNLSRPWEVP
jgi:hypothetical protein